MRAKDVKVGERYHHWSEPVVVESIEVSDHSRGAWKTVAICRGQDSGEEIRLAASYLTPWDEHQAEIKLAEAEQQESLRQVERIREAVGPGVTIGFSDQDNLDFISGNHAMLGFTEPAADKVLELCEAKPLPDNRRPSLAKSDEEWVKRSSLLGARLRRALGVGYAGRLSGRYAMMAGKLVATRVTLYGDDLQVAADKLAGQAPQTPDVLCELL